ncbi:MAG: 3-hydroxyacyl-CoA dehydrogenase family protein [Bacteroidales bacterium]|nr:3-hydroxyacyl-CoA dehydrogenase family protein [Bacteroidales bacterium]MBN2762001.1 3-hydroxyacyl-CoA dehydrogenase family protein [Bacteroidales bacterium]
MSEILVEPIEKYGLSKKDRPKTLFSKVGLVGCGLVGQSIALMISQKELEVIFIELSEEKISYAYQRIENELDNMINHWGMTGGEKRAILSRIKGHVGYEHLRGCDLVIETIRSKIREQRVICRREVFKNIEKYVAPDTIIATNSSTIVITELSAELEHKERCVSLHFLTSVPGSKMIEVVRGLYTSDEAYNKVFKFVKMLGKHAIPVEESPGLISVRMFVSMVNEACDIMMEGVGTKNDIDTTMRIGFGLPLGPFELADKVGLDKVLRYMDNLYSEFGDQKFKASPVIKKLVRAHQLGRITGKGFYEYDETGRKIN